MTTTADFAVIGGGIAGASAAYELAAHGPVVLLESEATTGYHTTGRSAAVYTEAYERGPVRTLTMASRAHLESPPEAFWPTPLLRPLPVLQIADTPRVGALDDIAAEIGSAIEIRRLDAAETEDYCPILRRGIVAGGLLEPGSMEIDVHALHQGFLAGAIKRGARVRTAAPVRAIVASERSCTVTAGQDTIDADVVVNAAGAWCDTVAALAGARSRSLRPKRRTAFTFDSPPDTDTSGWPMVIDVDERFYIKPERAQVMGCLAEETPMEPHDVRPDEIDVALAIERINAATTLDIRHVRRAWAGLRTFSPDRLPVVGFDPEVPRFFWLGGQGGYGIMTSPAMSRLASSLITRAGMPGDLASAGFEAIDVDPARFGS